MNEVLKELAVKAKVEHCISHVRLQEFAELIVKECIQLADQYGSSGAGSEFDVGYTSCANTLSDEFKKRFGVEE